MMMMDERVVLTSPHFAEHSSGAPRLPQAKKAKKAVSKSKKKQKQNVLHFMISNSYDGISVKSKELRQPPMKRVNKM
jgi:hypothetical protein